MAIVPKRKTSKQRKHKRQAHSALKSPNLVDCKNCSNKQLQHHICQFCGFYKNRKIIGFKAINDNK
ncbi:50S ribosomal protein L32 [Mesomycoplasma flocculare]|uniref:50S ribosomal protein L32 n=1 Tax=Mesomycoplasma flocculare TaxID=2128 RepID=UPI00137174CE|nr:50S ribosomal protein L32 [Mesomycoplasma flocculare]MXR06135.1 50S ribosomal protein L32 [Mesomycoplasma flocculare]MXR13586.1 50S ribosomal protein L32 [Mesomycoplasma flocculare]MXR23140.1 50S ribosomal protein L32 [Mesomycoplasma flocculare]